MMRFGKTPLSLSGVSVLIHYLLCSFHYFIFAALGFFVSMCGCVFVCILMLYLSSFSPVIMSCMIKHFGPQICWINAIYVYDSINLIM